MDIDYSSNYTFAVISLGFLGDTILVEPLCKNIKLKFPNSKILFIADSKFSELAKGFGSIDEIFNFDKKSRHKGILGYFHFKKDFKYKDNIDFAIITHPHERSVLAAKIINAKNIICLSTKKNSLEFLIDTKIKCDESELRNTYKADFNLKYLSPLCEAAKFPVTYERNDINYEEIRKKFNLPENYIVLSPLSKDVFKDWDYNNIKDFIQGCNKKTVLLGIQNINKISEQLRKDNVDFIDLSDKTSVVELGAVIKMSDLCISVDTGTFHLAYSQKIKTVGLFFSSAMTKEWAPKNLNNVKILIGKKCLKKGKLVCEKPINAKTVIEEADKMLQLN